MIDTRELTSQIKAALGIMHGSRAFTGPFQASIELTNRCNIRCLHCFFYSPYVEMPNFFALRRARQLSGKMPDARSLRQLQTLDADSTATHDIIDRLIRMGTKKFFFSGSGEPFLHKSILEFIGQVQRAGGSSIVYTNGTLLDRDKIDNLISLQCNELKITTLAGSRDVYARTHPGIPDDAFVKLRDSLIYLAEQKAASGLRYPEVSLHYVVLPQNCEDIENFIEFAGLVRADRVLFRPADTVGDQGLEAAIMLGREQQQSLKMRLTAMEAFLDSRGMENNISHFLRAFGRKMDTAELYRVIPCYYGWLGVRIDVEGNAYPCCKCYESMGNIQEQDFHSIWYGKGYRIFRNRSLKINRGGKKADGCECGSCTHFTANLLVFKALHPLKSRALNTNKLSSFSGE